MKRFNAKITRDVCFVSAILMELDGRLKTLAEIETPNSRAAVSAYQKLLQARRAHASHSERCAICRRLHNLATTRSANSRTRRRPPQALSPEEFDQLGDAVGALFEDELMRLARLECAARHGEFRGSDLSSGVE